MSKTPGSGEEADYDIVKKAIEKLLRSIRRRRREH